MAPRMQKTSGFHWRTAIVIVFVALLIPTDCRVEPSLLTKHRQEVKEEAVFRGSIYHEPEMETQTYPQWLKIKDDSLSLEALRAYDRFGDLIKEWVPISHTDKACTIKIRKIEEHHGRCVHLGNGGMKGCSTNSHLVINDKECNDL